MFSEGSMLGLHEMRTALEGMRREIEGAAADSENRFVVKDRDVYGKQASEISFSTFSTPLSGAAKVSYSVGEDEKTGRLYLLKKIHLAWEGDSEAREAEVLEEIESFSVELDSGGEWITTFDSTSRPRHVRVTIAVPLGERTVTLSETVKPMTGSKL
jgi:hypothetical protein